MTRTIIFAMASLLLNMSSYGSEMVSTYANAVTQDDNNNTYLATPKGVIRFDGSNNLTLADYTSLPGGWALSIDFDRRSNYLYVAYNSKGVWQLNLNNLNARQVTKAWARKIALSGNYLYMIGDNQLALSKLEGNEHLAIEDLGKVLDLSPISDGKGVYVVTEKGTYAVNGKSKQLIEEFGATYGKILATPYGAVYYRNGHLVSYNELTGELLSTKTDIVDHLVYSPPHTLYVAQKGWIKEVSLVDLKVSNKVLNKKFEAWKGLYYSTGKTVWGLKQKGVEVFDPSQTQIEMEPSKYRIIQPVNGRYWVGIDHGVLVQNAKGEYEPLAWLNDRLPLKTAVTAITQFDGGLILSTTNGAYDIDTDSKTIKRIFGEYVINSRYVDGTLYLCTGKGLVTFERGKMSAPRLTYEDKEVLNIRKIDDVIYLIMSDGLLNMSTSQVSLSGIRLTDIAKSAGDFYASSYGQGIFRLKGDKWSKIPSPEFVTGLVKSETGIYAQTNSGLFYFERDVYPELIESTGSQLYTPNSLVVTPNKLVAASQMGVTNINVTRSDIKPVGGFVSFARSQSSIVFNPQKIELDLSVDEWVDVSFSTYDYKSRDGIKLSYKIGDGDWVDTLNNVARIDGVTRGESTLYYRFGRFDGGWGQTKSVKVVVKALWYKSNFALTLYATVAVLVLIALSYFVSNWFRSIHRVFDALNSAGDVDKVEQHIHKAMQELSIGTQLCSGTAVQHTDGLVKLQEAMDTLVPLAYKYSSLGDKSLQQGLAFLQTHYAASYDVRIEIDVAIGQQSVDQKQATNIYALIYYAIEQSKMCKGKNIKVYLHKAVDGFNVTVQHDGNKIGLIKRKVDFDLTQYMINVNARKNGAKVKWHTKDKVNSLCVTFPSMLPMTEYT